ncbi:MAG: glucuronyl hydrolase [Clostridia bacterium]|nr:glucuronyl hydrolase [Clostridia bacterium]
MKHIVQEPILQAEVFQKVPAFTRQEAEDALAFCCKRLDETMDSFTDRFPRSSSENGWYAGGANDEWTCSFYTGMLWLAYALTGKDSYRRVAEHHTENFEDRLRHGDMDTHDIGFLYSLSCVAHYKLTGDGHAKDVAVGAADALMRRWKEKGEFFQAWGRIDDPANYRFIIDCMMNLPLLYWAGEETGNTLYTERAKKHLKTTLDNILREDASTFHTFFMDPETGLPHHGETHQGYSDDSCWARGQAWAVYGLPLSFGYTKDALAMEVHEKVTAYYLNRLPQDFVPYWDLIFTSGTQPRDSSSAAIAACGLDEAVKYIEREDLKQIYTGAADRMLRSLAQDYTTAGQKSNGILQHGVYAKPANRGVDECVIWGDYYYMEALMRKTDKWVKFW